MRRTRNAVGRNPSEVQILYPPFSYGVEKKPVPRSCGIVSSNLTSSEKFYDKSLNGKFNNYNSFGSVDCLDYCITDLAGQSSEENENIFERQES